MTLSPDENYFMTGSIDGTACIWSQPETAQDIIDLITDLENGRKEGGSKKEHPFKKNLIKELSVPSELVISQCDSLKWSCRGRYALVAFGGKETENTPIDKSIILVWDQRKKMIIRKYGGKDSKLMIESFTFVLETHPKEENFFISAGGGGKVRLWDLSQTDEDLQVIQTYSQSGVYQREPNLLNEVFDGKFSSCGKHFVSSTLEILSITDKEPYYSVPIEQFTQIDNNDGDNNEGSYLCNFDNMKYPEQPPPPIIGEKHLNVKLTPAEYEQQYEDRYDKFSKEQKFFENLASEYSQYALITPNNLDEDEDDMSSPGNRRGENRDRSMYYDPHNDEFDHESDEDFVVQSSHGDRGTRRTLRRQGYYTDQNRQEETKGRQLQQQNTDRETRRRNRNRQRNNNSDDQDDAEEYKNESEENEMDYDEDEEYSEQPSVQRNHNFYSSRVEELDSDEEIIEVNNKASKSKSSAAKSNRPFFGTRRIAIADGQKASINSFQVFLNKNDDEDYQVEDQILTDGYMIDLDEALKEKDQDKTALDCSFCKKKRGEQSLLGPFKYFIDGKVSDEMTYYVHRQCLERNDIVKQVGKYEFENIEACLNKLNNGESPECTRCGYEGATVS